jgi:citronellol/citronellal dehydrogenase
MDYQSVFRPNLFDGKVAIVTGGGSGIGRCIAHELAALGSTVVISGRNEEKLLQVRQEIEAQGGRVDHGICNIRSEEQIQEFIATTVEKHGRIDQLVNNAGGQFMAPIDGIKLKGWNAVIETNLTGTFLMCKEVKRQWMGKNGGSIVNIVADFWNGMPLMAHTSAARAGVVNFTKSAALQWAVSGVRINSVAPGIILSSGLQNYPSFLIELLKEMKKDIPAKRMGTESEVSATVMFLLSDAASFITGETVKVDGASSIYRQMTPIPDHEALPPYNGFHLQPDLPDEM